MSTFSQLIRGAARSNTVQLNSIFLMIWAALGTSDLVQNNPDLAAVFAGVQAVVNILLRFKTKVPLDQR